MIKSFRGLCTLSHALASLRRCGHDDRRGFAARISSQRLLSATSSELHGRGVSKGIERHVVRRLSRCMDICSETLQRNVGKDELRFASYRTSYASRLCCSSRTRRLALRGHRCENTGPVHCQTGLEESPPELFAVTPVAPLGINKWISLHPGGRTVSP